MTWGAAKLPLFLALALTLTLALALTLVLVLTWTLAKPCPKTETKKYTIMKGLVDVPLILLFFFVTSKKLFGQKK